MSVDCCRPSELKNVLCFREGFGFWCDDAIGVWALLLAVAVDLEFESLEDESAGGLLTGVWYSVGLVCAFES